MIVRDDEVYPETPTAVDDDTFQNIRFRNRFARYSSFDYTKIGRRHRDRWLTIPSALVIRVSCLIGRNCMSLSSLKSLMLQRTEGWYFETWQAERRRIEMPMEIGVTFSRGKRERARKKEASELKRAAFDAKFSLTREETSAHARSSSCSTVQLLHHAARCWI